MITKIIPTNKDHVGILVLLGLSHLRCHSSSSSSILFLNKLWPSLLYMRPLL